MYALPALMQFQTKCNHAAKKRLNPAKSRSFIEHQKKTEYRPGLYSVFPVAAYFYP